MKNNTGGVQLPNDVVSKGYKQIKPFKYEQVFYSATNDFKGTEQDFIQAGLGYRFTENNYKRQVV